MDVLDAVNKGWAWSGLKAAKVHSVSPMGHMLLSDAEDCFYYLDTDGMELQPLGNEDAARAHFAKDETKELWSATPLVEGAREMLGDPQDGYVFTLSPVNWIDGHYCVENMVILPLSEVAYLSGNLARQIKGLPVGAKVKIKLVD